jgi:hypothetical protein
VLLHSLHHDADGRARVSSFLILSTPCTTIGLAFACFLLSYLQAISMVLLLFGSRESFFDLDLEEISIAILSSILRDLFLGAATFKKSISAEFVTLSLGSRGFTLRSMDFFRFERRIYFWLFINLVSTHDAKGDITDEALPLSLFFAAFLDTITLTRDSFFSNKNNT